MRVLTDIMDIVVWPAEGDPIFIADQSRRAAETFIEDIRSYDHFLGDKVVTDPRGRSLVNRSPMPLVADVLREKGLASGHIGFEQMHLPVNRFVELQALLPSAELVDCKSLFDEARMIKTPAEIKLLHSAGIATEKAIQIGFELARPGDTAKSLANAIGSAMTKLGAEQVAFMDLDVMSGGKMFRLQYSDEPGELKQGSLIRVDAGGYFGGYYSDIARMAVVGEPTAEQRSIYGRLYGVERKMIEEILKPGRSGGEMYELTAAAFEEFGVPLRWRTLCHGLGLFIHERPWLTKSETYRLQPGMVLAVEPGLPSTEEVWHIEDLVLVTEEGTQELTTYSSIDELYVIG